MSNNHDLLDVEDDDARQHRILSILQRTDAATASTRAHRPSPTIFLPPSPIHPIPISDLISRAEAFLPRLAASNADLVQRAALDPASVDIEHLADEGEHIEMNLGLGVFEQRPRTTESHHPSSDSDSESSESESTSSSSSSDPCESSDDLDSDASSSGAPSDDPSDAQNQSQSLGYTTTIQPQQPNSHPHSHDAHK